jgi:hypothetical protein
VEDYYLINLFQSYKENMARRVSFWARKKIPKRVNVSFRDRYGRRVSFTGTKYVPRRVRVSFWARKRSRRY